MDATVIICISGGAACWSESVKEAHPRPAAVLSTTATSRHTTTTSRNSQAACAAHPAHLLQAVELPRRQQAARQAGVQRQQRHRLALVCGGLEWAGAGSKGRMRGHGGGRKHGVARCRCSWAARVGRHIASRRLFRPPCFDVIQKEMKPIKHAPVMAPLTSMASSTYSWRSASSSDSVCRAVCEGVRGAAASTCSWHRAPSGRCRNGKPIQGPRKHAQHKGRQRAFHSNRAPTHAFK